MHTLLATGRLSLALGFLILGTAGLGTSRTDTGFLHSWAPALFWAYMLIAAWFAVMAIQSIVRMIRGLQ